MRNARRDDWETHPLPRLQRKFPLDRRFPASSMEKIRRGYVAEEMEDKWFIYWEDDRLHFHRSWTGNCIYMVRFEQGGKSWRMVEGVVNEDPDEYTPGDDAYEAEMVGYLVDLLLLRRRVGFPKRGESEGEEAMRAWQMAGRAMFGEYPGDEDRE